MSARKLIGDVGATSGKWALMEDGESSVFSTPGYNPVSQGRNAWHSLADALKKACAQADHVIYYGTGVMTASEAGDIHGDLLQVSPGAQVEVFSDLLAAARALCGDQEGVVAILGTGSSVCMYDGQQISRTRPSLGFPYGDEGSGWRIGLDMVRGYYYGVMPRSLRSEFAERLPGDRLAFLSAAKVQEAPNAYLASFATFAASHAQHPWVQECVNDRFAEFVKLHLSEVGGIREVHCAGGIAKVFERQLRVVFDRSGVACGKIIDQPLPHLLTFHK